MTKLSQYKEEVDNSLTSHHGHSERINPVATQPCSQALLGEPGNKAELLGTFYHVRNIKGTP